MHRRPLKRRASRKGVVVQVGKRPVSLKTRKIEWGAYLRRLLTVSSGLESIIQKLLVKQRGLFSCTRGARARGRIFLIGQRQSHRTEMLTTSLQLRLSSEVLRVRPELPYELELIGRDVDFLFRKVILALFRKVILALGGLL